MKWPMRVTVLLGVNQMTVYCHMHKLVTDTYQNKIRIAYFTQTIKTKLPFSRCKATREQNTQTWCFCSSDHLDLMINDILKM